MMPAPDVIAFLESRRSSRPAMLSAPGPSSDELETILRLATRVPDHRKLAPWRFVVIDGEARVTLGNHLAKIVEADSPEGEPATELRLQTERERFTHAPVVIAAISAPHGTERTPAVEQVLSCGAACFAMCLAANALGYHTAWVTDWPAYDARARQLLGIGDGEEVAGFIHIGMAATDQDDRDRPALADVVTRWQDTESS
ncbi:MAG: nitroreductase [Pseudomonadota bacterium]